MKPKEITPAITAIAPAALASPLILAGLAVGVGLIWLFSREEEKPRPTEDNPKPQAPERVPSFVPNPVAATSKRIRRDDLAEALRYGEKPLSRKEAVAALERLGFRKSSAYKALSTESRFAGLIEFTPDGLIGWKG